MSLTKEAIDTLAKAEAITAASAAVATALTHVDSSTVALPDDFQLHDLEQFQPLRRRARGKFTTRFIAPFADYVRANESEGTTVFVHPTDVTATAVLDLGTTLEPGHADNRATLEPVRTAAYAALLQATARQLSQQDLAEFLEDWADLVQTYRDSEEVRPALAIAAIRKITIDSSRKITIDSSRKITIDSSRKVESEEQSLSASRSAFESIAATSKDPLPTHIYFTTQPYADIAARLFVLRLSVLTGDAKPKLQLRIQKAEEHAEQIAQEFADKVAVALDAGAAAPGTTVVQVLVGSYTKGQ